ncbi:MAG TPA: M1 family aminopeptidase [Pyrinomonadaceae bacterium]|jgi:aminopeptidase N
MTLRILFISMLTALACGALHGAERNADPEPGVPRGLARFRAAHYSNVRYALQIEITSGAPLLKGRAEIRVHLDGEADQLVLDWRTNSVKQGQPQARAWDIEVNGESARDARQVNEHLIIPGTYLSKGENIVRLRFESAVATSGSAVTRYLDREDSSEYIYTLFVPSDASTVFPCFDQPDLKARFEVSITAPTSWTVVSNTNADTVTRSGANSIWHFPSTEPISTYLFAFAAGPFKEFRDEASPIPVRLFVRQSKAERARKELPEVFRLNREGLAFLARYFDYKFPFPKYDLVIVPEFAYGGMEHAGATFLREESILFPTDPTANDLLSRAELMFHEAAHQWFGDLVTMRWFDDLWLKEGFATFMAYKAIEAIMPQYNAWKAFYQRTKPSAYITDITKGTTPIWQEIVNLSAAKSAYGNIVYRKAPSMLRQAEFFLGEDKFQGAVRLVLKEHAFGNAEWADLVGAFERTSKRKLDEWANAWVKRRGMADLSIEWSADAKGRIDSLKIKQEDLLGEGSAWPMRIQLLLAYDDAQPETLTVMLTGSRETRVPNAVGRRRPAYVFANYNDYGYGRFLLDDKSEREVISRLGTVRDEFLRALLWGSLWDSVRDARLAPVTYIDMAIRLIPSERDEVTVQSITGRASTAFNRYLSGAQIEELAPRIERLFSTSMLKAETVGLRITYFRAFLSIASTEEARATLKKILRGELLIPGMTLRSRDRFDIITALLARNDKDAPALLEAQSKVDTTDDGRRYSFAAGAAREDGATKKRYFDAYVNDPKLAESWIEASLVPFNAIQQSDLTLPYLEPALRQLPVLKRTRKIFFVNGWLSAFIGGQCDERALAVVQNFLGREGSLDRDLRLKVLEVADGLERCVRIRSKFARP